MHRLCPSCTRLSTLQHHRYTNAACLAASSAFCSMAVNLSPSFSGEDSTGSARIGEKYEEVFQGQLARTSKSTAVEGGRET